MGAGWGAGAGAGDGATGAETVTRSATGGLWAFVRFAAAVLGLEFVRREFLGWLLWVAIFLLDGSL
jgi:hypothetical protein